MSLPDTTLSTSQKFGQFMGEFCGHLGEGLGKLEQFIVTKITNAASVKPELKNVLDKIEANQEKISRCLYAVGCFYNFWQSSTIFLAGLGVGFLASASPFPLSFPSLRNGEMLGHTKENNYSAPKAMFSLAVINAYIGDTFIDNAFFGSLSGIMAGNSLYHMVKDSPIGTGTRLLTDKAEEASKVSLNAINSVIQTLFGANK